MDNSKLAVVKNAAIVILAALGLIFMGACASDPAPDEDNVVRAKTSDPIGPPSHIESEVGKEYPSSVAGGAGNAESSGMNTNLNPVPPEKKEAKVTITETPMVTETETRVVVAEPEVDVDADLDVDVEEPVEVTVRKPVVRETTKKE